MSTMMRFFLFDRDVGSLHHEFVMVELQSIDR